MAWIKLERCSKTWGQPQHLDALDKLWATCLVCQWIKLKEEIINKCYIN